MRFLNKDSFRNLVLLGSCLMSTQCLAEQQYASRERATVARAHISRARSLMVEALAEFEESKKYARPDMLIDSEDWRLRVISLTEQLNRIVDPKPRVTREGAVFRTPPRLVKRQKDQLPDVADGAYSRSDAGERARMKQKQQERARLFSEKEKSQQGSKSNLPADLALPEEPILEDLRKNEKKSDSTQQQESKNLFSNDLMPQIQDSKEAPAKKLEDKSIAGKGKIVEEDKIVESLPVEPKKSIVGEAKEVEVPIENKLQNEAQNELQKQPIVDDESDIDVSENQLIPPQEKAKSNSIITNDSVPTVDDEAGLTEEEAAKQVTEDDELARKLEDSLSQKLSEGRN